MSRLRRFLRNPKKTIFAYLAAHIALAQQQDDMNKYLERFASCGRGVRLNGRSKIISPEFIKIGDNVHIGDNAYINGAGGLEIGDNTHVSRNLVLYTVNHNYRGERLPYDDTNLSKPVTIGRNVWIGMNVCIAPGTVIGEGAIIAMGTVVSGEVPAGAIIGSPPWRKLSERDREHYEALDRAKRYGGPSGKPIRTNE